MIKIYKPQLFALSILFVIFFLFKVSYIVEAEMLFLLRLVNDNGTYYLLKDNQRFGITNPGMLYSYGFEFKDAQPAEGSDLAFPIGELLLPGNGSLVKSPISPTVWLISSGKRYGFTSGQVFLGLGFKFSSVLTVTHPELEKLTQGSLLKDTSSSHLDGIDINDNGTIYWISEGKKYGYPSLQIYNSWHKDNDFSQVVPANDADLVMPVGGLVTERVLNSNITPIFSAPSTSNSNSQSTSTLPVTTNNPSFSTSTQTSSLPTVYYVSSQGSDTNIGTIDKPFQTIEKVKKTIRDRGSNFTSDITVYLRGGTYGLTEPLSFDYQDSGKNGFTVIYKNYPNEIPIISGGKIVGNWTQEGNMWKAYVGSGLTVRQFYVNGKRAIRARSNGGLAGATKIATGYTTSDTSMQNWANVSDIEFVSNTFWRLYRCPVQGISGGNITMQQPCFDRSQADKYQGYDGTMGLPTWIENAFELLDSSGEWYYNRTTGYLYYIPRSGENMISVVAVVPALENLIIGNNVSNIKFEGLTFSYATWNKPSTAEGFAEVQANFATYNSGGQFTPPLANVTFTGTKNVQLERNVFIHLGGAAVHLGNGSQNNLIRGNNFYDISSNGIMIGDNSNPKETNANLITKDNIISNNFIRRAGVEYQGAVGIWIGYTQNSVVEYNELANLPYTGISLGWGWGANDPTVAKDNKIQNNYIHDHMKALVDGGGIYTLSAQPGSVIANNVIQNQVDEYGAIYLDSKSRYFNVYNNILFSNKRSALIKGGDHNIHDNWWQNRVLLGTYPQDVLFTEQDFGANTVQNNHTIQALSEAPAFIVSNAGIQTAYQNIKNLVTDNLEPILKLSQTAQLQTPPTTVLVKSKIGVFRNGSWLLDENGDFVWDSGQADTLSSFGQAGDTVVLGDWNGDGKTKIGVFRSGTWYLDTDGNGVWDNGIKDTQLSFGQNGDIPVVGDWNGNSKSKIGVFRAGTWYLDTDGNGVWDNGIIDTQVSLGQNGDVPIVGDWNGNGKSKVGLFRLGSWYLDYDGNGVWDGGINDELYSFGQNGDMPVIGDWTGDKKTKIGIFRNGVWQLDTNADGIWNIQTDTQASLGQSGDIPVLGDWDNSGKVKIGMFRNGAWYLDTDGDKIVDVQASFGQTGDTPITGKW